MKINLFESRIECGRDWCNFTFKDSLKRLKLNWHFLCRLSSSACLSSNNSCSKIPESQISIYKLRIGN